MTGIMAMIIATSTMAMVFNGIPILGENYTEQEAALVMIGSKIYCDDATAGEVREQCFIEYYKKHNYTPTPITE